MDFLMAAFGSSEVPPTRVMGFCRLKARLETKSSSATTTLTVWSTHKQMSREKRSSLKTTLRLAIKDGTPAGRPSQPGRLHQCVRHLIPGPTARQEIM